MPVTTSAIRVAIGTALGNGESYKSIAKGSGIHRRTISRLDAGEDVELRLSQLEALHSYLSEQQLPILLQPKVATALQSSEQVHVLVPAYRDASDDHRRLCSPWDVLAADRIRTPLESGSLPGRTFLKSIANDLAGVEPMEAVPEAVSRICIGSPRATRLFDTFATRLTMFGAARHRDTIPLPFQFYWKKDPPLSPFVMDHSEVPARLRNNTQFKLARAALIFEDREPLLEISNLDNPSLKEFPSYAVVLTRWVSQQSLWACVAGLTGPATEAAARKFLSLDFAIPRPKQPEELANTPLAVHLFKVMMTVPKRAASPDDLRALKADSVEQLGSTRYLFGPTPTRNR